jgi:hypothetical protein
MRVRVKAIDPRPVVDAASERPGQSATPDDLGPRGDEVRSLIDRAARLSPAHRKRLADEERWRAWPISLAPAGGLAAVRASAYGYARQIGRPRLPAMIAATVQGALGDDDRDRDLRRAVEDAALATALADVLPDDTRERLRAAWRIALG